MDRSGPESSEMKNENEEKQITKKASGDIHDDVSVLTDGNDELIHKYQSLPTEEGKSKERSDKEEEKILTEEEIALQNMTRVIEEVVVSLKAYLLENKHGKRRFASKILESLHELESTMLTYEMSSKVFYNVGGFHYCLRILKYTFRNEDGPDNTIISSHMKDNTYNKNRKGSKGIIENHERDQIAILEASFRCLTHLVPISSKQNLQDAIKVHGLLNAAIKCAKYYPNENELQISSLKMILEILMKLGEDKIIYYFEGGAMLDMLAKNLLCCKQKLTDTKKQKKNESDGVQYQIIITTLTVARLLCSGPEFGSRCALGICLYDDWSTLKFMIDLLKLEKGVDVNRMINTTICFDEQENLKKLLQSTACSAILCFCAQSSVVANKISCYKLPAFLVNLVKFKFAGDTETVKWLKQALLEFEACRIRGDLSDKPLRVAEECQRARNQTMEDLHKGLTFSRPKSTSGGQKRRLGNALKDKKSFTASEYAANIVLEYERRRDWLREIDSFIKNHTNDHFCKNQGRQFNDKITANKDSNLRNMFETPISPSLKKNQGYYSEFKNQVSPYALPILPGFEKELQADKDAKIMKKEGLMSPIRVGKRFEHEEAEKMISSTIDEIPKRHRKKASLREELLEHARSGSQILNFQHFVTNNSYYFEEDIEEDGLYYEGGIGKEYNDSVIDNMPLEVQQQRYQVNEDAKELLNQWVETSKNIDKSIIEGVSIEKIGENDSKTPQTSPSKEIINNQNDVDDMNIEDLKRHMKIIRENEHLSTEKSEVSQSKSNIISGKTTNKGKKEGTSRILNTKRKKNGRDKGKMNPTLIADKEETKWVSRKVAETEAKTKEKIEQLEHPYQLPSYTGETLNKDLTAVAKRLLGDPAEQVYGEVNQALDINRNAMDRLSFAQRLEILSISVKGQI